MGVQPLPIDSVGFEFKRGRTQPLFWLGIALAERLIAGALLIMLFPLLLFLAGAVVALSRRSPLIAHRRVGHAGRPIWVLKLRTMWERKHASGRLAIGFATIVERIAPEPTIAVDVKTRNDPRVTSRFAALCRRYSIDELPQLWHVLRGEMALVGPRPLTAAEIEAYYGLDASQLLSRKPGLSGLWQIKGRSRLNYLQRRRLDLFLIRNWSLPLYLRILIATVPTVCAGKDAW